MGEWKKVSLTLPNKNSRITDRFITCDKKMFVYPENSPRLNGRGLELAGVVLRDVPRAAAIFNFSPKSRTSFELKALIFLLSAARIRITLRERCPNNPILLGHVTG